MVDNHSNNSGFALLVSLIVVGVVLSVGLVILDLTIKQVRLAATTKDSETAFHAANAGMECARYWRRAESADIILANDIDGSLNCFGLGAAGYQKNPVPSSGGGAAEQYLYEFSWPAGNPNRCTKVNMISAVVPVGDPDAVIDIDRMNGSDGSPALMPGYPGSTDVVCQAGSQCTTITVRGYNQACPSSGTFGYGVVERKVLLEF